MHGADVDYVGMVADAGSEAARWGLVADYLRDQSQLAPAPVPLRSPWAGLPAEQLQQRRETLASLVRAATAKRNAQGRLVPDWGTLRALMGGELAAQVISDVREATTYAEAVNSRRLEQLAWCWDQCLRMAKAHPEQRAYFEQLRNTFEGIATHVWRLDVLSTERGWAQAATRRYDLLPTVLREWKS